MVITAICVLMFVKERVDDIADVVEGSSIRLEVQGRGSLGLMLVVRAAELGLRGFGNPTLSYV